MRIYTVYFYWTPADRWAFSGEYRLDRFKVEKEIIRRANRPDILETMTAPLTLRYFHPAGFFSGLGLTYVDQAVEDPSSAETNTEQFVTLNTVIGYRFPKRLGIMSIAINNLLDQDFRFQDDNFRISVPARAFGSGDLDLGTVSNFVPDRTILGVVTLSF